LEKKPFNAGIAKQDGRHFSHVSLQDSKISYLIHRLHFCIKGIQKSAKAMTQVRQPPVAMAK